VPHATGVPVLFLESSDAVVQAFLQAFSYAIVAITLVLFLTMEKKIDVFLVLVPLLLASLLTGAAMTLAGVHFNFANIIALPLVFGMGVDNCIHMVHRFRTAPPKDGILLNTSTALAVVLSALTNISGFGSLSISAHRGMASMGVMLSIGILATLVCSMIVLPALLEQLEHLDRRLNRQNPDASEDAQ
jgi:predicted RND superfamily exporter protein